MLFSSSWLVLAILPTTRGMVVVQLTYLLTFKYITPELVRVERNVLFASNFITYCMIILYPKYSFSNKGFTIKYKNCDKNEQYFITERVHVFMGFCCYCTVTNYFLPEWLVSVLYSSNLIPLIPSQHN